MQGKINSVKMYVDNAHAKHPSVRKSLIYGTIEHESGFNQHARSTYTKGNGSTGHAYGYMQLLPETAAQYGVAFDDIYDPERNIEAGTHLLSDLLARYHGNERAMLAAYYAGPGNVARHGIEHYATYIDTSLNRAQKYLAYDE